MQRTSNIKQYILCFVMMVGLLSQAAVYAQTQTATEEGYTYQYVEDDPLNARVYTLDNGLTVYLSVNLDEPRVQTYVAVRAGSKHDPSDATGLAHYLEHMLFKGTDNIGTIKWEEEQKYLQHISDLYEAQRNTDDPDEKLRIYKQIDSVAQIAAQYAVPNEYDKLVSSIGAKRTNAYTSNEETVYMNDIPANELERWLYLESERFQTLVLRLFHTELETVYEEYNMRRQDLDAYKVWNAIYKALFDKHTYYQSTIGLSEHLKNPSMEKIHDYFNTYYVPNNIAICLSGDLDPTATIKLVDKYFGDWEAEEVPPFEYEAEDTITEPMTKEVWGPEPEEVTVAYRLDGADSKDALYIDLLGSLLYNRTAGLFDLNLNQKQKVLSASAFASVKKDYSLFILSGDPREGQSLEEVRDLMLNELDKVKTGDFEAWLLEAVVNNRRYRRVKQAEHNFFRGRRFVSNFILEQPWEAYVNKLDRMEAISKEELVNFVKEKFTNNYVVVYKREGEDPNRVTVEKPPITPVQLNRDTTSAFYRKFINMPETRLKPVFLDYEADIDRFQTAQGLDMHYIHNELNKTFNLYYILDMGSDHDKHMELAVEYLPYLGTTDYSAEELQKAFFRLGLNFSVSTSRDRIYVSLAGLDRNLEEGVRLFEHILAKAQPDAEALENMIDGILKERQDHKKSKVRIMWGGMKNYGEYGENSPFTNILSEAKLREVKPETLVRKIHNLTGYQHRLFYYGSQTPDATLEILNTHHQVPDQLQEYPEPVEYTRRDINKDEVFFVDYDMVQVQLMMLSKGPQYNKAIEPVAALFNQYFGSGLSSVVFQEIREAKALAYSAFARFGTPRYADEPHYVYAFVGTQSDKLNDALTAMRDLMNAMPEAREQFEAAREAAMKRIETDRITKTSIFWNYESARRRGLDYDIRKDTYAFAQEASITDVAKFFNEYIKGKNYTFLVMGDKESIPVEALRELGPFEELSLETLFNY